MLFKRSHGSPATSTGAVGLSPPRTVLCSVSYLWWNSMPCQILAWSSAPLAVDVELMLQRAFLPPCARVLSTLSPRISRLTVSKLHLCLWVCLTSPPGICGCLQHLGGPLPWAPGPSGFLPRLECILSASQFGVGVPQNQLLCSFWKWLCCCPKKTPRKLPSKTSCFLSHVTVLGVRGQLGPSMRSSQNPSSLSVCLITLPSSVHQ